MHINQLSNRLITEQLKELTGAELEKWFRFIKTERAARVERQTLKDKAVSDHQGG